MAAQGISTANIGGIYAAPNVRTVNHQVPGAPFLKGGWLRSPLDLSMSFASEQAIDQLAFLANMDPWQFRQKNITDPRWRGVLDAAAEAAGWVPRRAYQNSAGARVVRGHGIGLGTHLVSYGGAVADIEVDRETGKVAIRRLFGAIEDRKSVV